MCSKYRAGRDAHAVSLRERESNRSLSRVLALAACAVRRQAAALAAGDGHVADIAVGKALHRVPARHTRSAPAHPSVGAVGTGVGTGDGAIVGSMVGTKPVTVGDFVGEKVIDLISEVFFLFSGGPHIFFIFMK